MTDDLNRKDDHLSKHAALCNVETGIEVTADEGNVLIDDTRGGVLILTPFQARLLSDALLEVAFAAEGNGLKG